ncbi:MAG: hypothetical protein AB7G17_04810 [Phycisphaerales bacterium]
MRRSCVASGSSWRVSAPGSLAPSAALNHLAKTVASGAHSRAASDAAYWAAAFACRRKLSSRSDA